MIIGLYSVAVSTLTVYLE